jgi:large subunit ribosomal protein L2
MLKLSNYCIAIMGKMSNETHFVTRIHNAGKNRKLGFRPTVRGISKNPCDHPHGVEKEQVLLRERIKPLMVN